MRQTQKYNKKSFFIPLGEIRNLLRRKDTHLKKENLYIRIYFSTNEISHCLINLFRRRLMSQDYLLFTYVGIYH